MPSQVVDWLDKYWIHKTLVKTGSNLASVYVWGHILDRWGIRWRRGESAKLIVVNTLKSYHSRIMPELK
jgi:hypothetical protein